jgi:hypothetical protein
MCRYKVEKYYIGLEDGFVVKDNLKIKSPPYCNPLLIPFIYDDTGKKQLINDGDYIMFKDGEKSIQNNIIIKFKKYM